MMLFSRHDSEALPHLADFAKPRLEFDGSDHTHWRPRQTLEQWITSLRGLTA